MKQILTGKKILLLFCFSLLSFGLLMAQKKVSEPTDLAGFQLQVMKERLSLTDAQITKLTPIVKQDTETNKDASAEDAKKAGEAREAKYKEILTADQYTKWQKEKAEIKDEAQFRYLTSDAYAREFENKIKSD